MGQDEVVSNVHKACDSLEEVGRRGPANHQAPVMGQDLLFLPAAVEGAMHHACGALCLLRVGPTVGTVVHLCVDRACRAAFLATSWTLSARQLARRAFGNIGILAQRALDVLRIGVHIVEHLISGGSWRSELADVVGPLDELVVNRGIEVTLILQRRVLVILLLTLS